MLFGHDNNFYLAAVRKALQQCLILSAIILVVVSETKFKLFTCLMSGVFKGLFNTQVHTVLSDHTSLSHHLQLNIRNRISDMQLAGKNKQRSHCLGLKKLL